MLLWVLTGARTHVSDRVALGLVMFKQLILENWKSFRYTELEIDPLTIFIFSIYKVLDIYRQSM